MGAGRLSLVGAVDSSPRPTVVLVDDSTDVRALVRARLESSGLFEVVGEAADGEHAVDLVLRHQPELVLLDVSIPAMDGLETLPAILAVRPETTVVMFSGFGGADLVRELRALGARDVIEKSLPLDELPDRLLRAVRGPGHRPTTETTALPSEPVDDPRSAEQAVLEEHLEGFRALFDRAAIGMATLTVDASIVRANQALADIMSCEPRDLVGIDYGVLTGGAGDVLDQRLADFRSAGTNVATFEHRIPDRPGTTGARTALVTLVPVRDSAGHVLYAFAQVQEITAQLAARDELHLTEQHFSLLVAAVEEYAIYMLDTDGMVMSWNAGARRIKGYESHEIVGRHFRVFYPVGEQLVGHPEHNLEAALRTGSHSEEGWRVRRDGSRFWAGVVITALRDEAGRHVGFAKITRDQTEQQRHAQERLDAMAQQARLLAVTAHELRNPTAVIDGSAHVLERSGARMTLHERDQFFRGIRSSVDRLRRLGADLAAASQLQGGGMHVELAPVPVDELVRSAAARRAAVAPDAHVEVDADSQAIVHGDEVRLAQALDNLVDNAVRHGAAPIRVRAQARGDEVLVEVTDAGPGVPDTLTPRLFDRFATGGSAGGTGLGLYLVREIVRGHGGEVVYEPPDGERPTTFRLVLPVAAAKH